MASKRFLFVSYDGLIADIAWQVVKEGQEVRFWIKDPAEQQIADGLVHESEAWREEVDWADLVVFGGVVGEGEEGGGAPPRVPARGRRLAVHGSAGGRPGLRPAGAEGGGGLHHPAGELHLVRRRAVLRAGQPQPLRDQALGGGAELQAAPVRGRGG